MFAEKQYLRSKLTHNSMREGREIIETYGALENGLSQSKKKTGKIEDSRHEWELERELIK